ncbi:MAG: hypothetical protein KBT03_13795 [Bacteroidales bacterium]|nr:hypothetical protein [Candidatus Scybalousia scybalohippi]
MFEEFTLPNGKVATSTADVDKYLKESGLAMASDYSTGYTQKIQYEREKGEKQKMFYDFVQTYKQRIWNE